MMKLEEITSPAFLKNLTYLELESLCKEIRSFIVNHVAKTGGHLSSNLGIVELTVALHRIFNTEQDKLIFDVGHQCYVHKLLTGRAVQFDNLRGFGGISGFQSRKESIHDCYEGGHSSTSISAALGFAMARDHLKQDHSVIAVIGDASIGNGMAYEALNHVGEYKGPLIIILNDNNMSIGKNIGAVHHMLEHVRRHVKYYETKTLTKKALEQVPFGEKLISKVSDTKRRLKGFYFHGKYLFAQLGINYYGPIDGHNLEELEQALMLAKLEDKPVLIHVLTEKGKGYPLCQNDTDGKWHGVGAFDPATGKVFSKPDTTSYSKVLSDTLCDLAAKDEKLVAITPAMATGAKLLGFKEKYPDRFIDTGIAEEHALVLANALAVGGMHPYITIYSTFLQRGYDQIVHDIARMEGRVVIGIDRAGIIGEDGISHQGIYDPSFLLPVPNIVLTQPKDAEEATRLLVTAFQQDKPFAIRHSKNAQVPMAANLEPLPVGSWEMLSEGKDGVIISYGDLLAECKIAQKQLLEEKLELGVVNARFLKPYDEEMFKALLANKKPIFVCEEAVQIGSLGSYLSAEARRLAPAAELYTIGVPDKFIQHGKRAQILAMLELDGAGLAKQIKKYLKECPDGQEKCYR